MLSALKKLAARIQGGKIDWDEIEAALVQSDLGLPLSRKILDSLKSRPLSGETIATAAAESIRHLWLRPVRRLRITHGAMQVWLIVGVNGSGKTTSIAKLARRYQSGECKVHLVGADTFRAAAIEQLQIWAGRIGTGFSGGTEGGDPAAAAYLGLEDAARSGANLVLIDTAGRLHNKENLMRELEKVKRVLQKKVPEAPHEVLCVVDGTNGVNAVEQVRQFHHFLGLTGLIVTKMDASAKGGAIAAIKEAYNIEPLFVGSGESAEDLKEFDPQEFVSRFF